MEEGRRDERALKQERAAKAAADAPHRFFTLEFLIYFVIIFLGEFWMIPVDLGNELARMCYESPKCTRYLRSGSPYMSWVGQVRDGGDYQWSDFQKSLPLLLVFMAAWAVMSFALSTSVWRRVTVQVKAWAYVIVCFAALCVMHNYSVVWLVLLVSINYVISRALVDSPALPLVTWVYALASLFFVHHMHDLLRFGAISPSLAHLDGRHQMMRWHVTYNLLVLRLISWNLDVYWAKKAAAHHPAPASTVSASSVSLMPPSSSSSSSLSSSSSSSSSSVSGSDASKPARQPSQYSEYERSNVAKGAFLAPHFYFLYIFYIPLYFAGPIISANAFLSQFSILHRRIPLRTVLLYAIRVLAVFLLFDWIAHRIFVFAVVYSGTWVENVANLSPYYILLFAYTAVHVMWLKFYIIWRFFRLWALADNIDPVENMSGCVDLNGSVRGFWLIWHRSFNRWLIRYLYVPIGGKERYALSVVLVFTFTAVWHDLELRLLLWGWCMALVIIPEAMTAMYFSKKRYPNLRSQWFFRHLEALGSAFNTLFIISLNLLGFSIGTDVGGNVLHAFYGWHGLYYLFWTFAFLISGFQLGQEYKRVFKRG